MATQAERRERTRTAIVESARALFVERGFAATTIGDIQTAADVSRGALYHHFPGKDEVFEAVFVETSTEAIRRAKESPASAATAIEAFIEGCLAWVDIATEPEVAQIMFVDGPVALGWQRCRELEDEASLGVVRNGLAVAARQGQLAVADLDLMAQLINAVLAEAALAVHHRRKGASRAATRRSITALIGGLASD